MEKEGEEKELYSWIEQNGYIIRLLKSNEVEMLYFYRAEWILGFSKI